MPNKRHFSLSLWILPLVLLLLLSGCGDDDAGSTGDPGTLDRVWSYSVIQGCGTCHSREPGATAEGEMDLRTKSSFRENLVNKSLSDHDWTTIRTFDCADGNRKYIVSGSSNDSYLLDALGIQTGCSGTSNYHSDQNVNISNALENDLIQWISAGANP